MKRIIYLLSIVCISTNALSQMSEKEILDHRKDHLIALTDSSTKMLTPDEIKAFQGLDYFDFDSTFQIQAKLKKKKGKKFEMATSTDRKPIYRRYGYLFFTIDDIECNLEVYQYIALKKNSEYKNYLFTRS